MAWLQGARLRGGRGRLRRPSVAKVADVAARKSQNRGAATARYAVTIGRQAIGYSSKETVKEAGKGMRPPYRGQESQKDFPYVIGPKSLRPAKISKH
jgi:hypothetical protein